MRPTAGWRLAVQGMMTSPTQLGRQGVHRLRRHQLAVGVAQRVAQRRLILRSKLARRLEPAAMPAIKSTQHWFGGAVAAHQVTPTSLTLPGQGWSNKAHAQRATNTETATCVQGLLLSRRYTDATPSALLGKLVWLAPPQDNLWLPGALLHG